ncbi:MAG: hypothetical protein COT17_02745 [Elusimicrobia bacterium CG08_land_8_20_14_0_20_51_18]|nr:MAG: hypothetical protein COT17_02745 [Elusimicrobia bacterium CG08_land_8_20_14_0_20_51_18]
MIKKLIEVTILSILVVGLVYLLNQLGPLGADARVALKYLWLGLLGLAALGIVSVTLIALAAIILGIPFIKSMSGADGGFWSRRGRGERSHGDEVKAGIGGFVGETVGGALKGAFGSIKDIKNLSSREVGISVEKYGWDRFKIKTLNGDLEVSGHDEPGAKAFVEVLEKEEGDAEAFFEDGEIKLKSKSGARTLMGDARISLPKKLSSINVESVNGDIKVTDFATENASAFKGVNGDLSVERFSNTGEVSVKTVSGDVTITESRFNSLLSQSISGDIVIKDTAAESAVLKTVSGDIDYAESDIKNPVVKTVSGSVKK